MGDSVRRCRLEVEDALRQWNVPTPLVGDAVLVLGELAGNAVRHAGTHFTVTVVSLPEGTVRLEVSDNDTRPPSLLGLDAESTSGRGLHIVAGVARDWGWQTTESDDGVSGKRVWAELAFEGRTPDP